MSDRWVPVIESWGNHLFKGLIWLVGVIVVVLYGNPSDVISISIDWTIGGQG